jgi:hypothetical protein
MTAHPGGMARRKVSNELWAALEPLIPVFAPPHSGSGPLNSSITSCLVLVTNTVLRLPASLSG